VNPDILMKGVVASYLKSPQGMEMIHNYISSDEGHAVISEYLSTPRGRQTVLEILPLVLDVADLPDDIKNAIRENLEKKN